MLARRRCLVGGSEAGGGSARELIVWIGRGSGEGYFSFCGLPVKTPFGRRLSRSGFVLLLFLMLTTAPRVSRAADPSLPQLKLNTGEAQLFVDDYLISQQNDLSRTLHQPRKDNGGNEPVIALADEFGQTKGTLEANGTIL